MQVLRSGLAVISLLATLILASPALAQVMPPFGDRALDSQLLQQAQRQAAQRAPMAASPSLEGALDPDEYVVGPGDQFTIAIGGNLAQELHTTVSADGHLLIAEVGRFQVAGRTLAEVDRLVRPSLQRIYRNVPAELALTAPRRFYVHVSGAVERPGRHESVPIARVEDAVAAAMSDFSPLQYLRALEQRARPNDELPALRNIEVRRADGSVLSVDLLRYYATGDTDFNPHLLDGDRIFVPTIERDSHRRVFVERERSRNYALSEARNRSLDYRSDDTVTSLLLLKGGPTLLQETDQVRLLRTGGDGRVSTTLVDVAAIRNGIIEDVSILPQDRLLIMAPIERRGSVSIVGEVKHPGSYPIIEDVTTLHDLLEASGGLLPGALLRGAYLERHTEHGSPEDRDRAMGSAADEAALAVQRAQERVFERERASYESARLSALGFGSRNYLARELLEFQRVSLEIGDDPGQIPNVRLRDGDRFVVPRDPEGVLVLGQVRHPGYVDLIPGGASAEQYIAAAGGLGPAATEVYVREAGTGYIRPVDGHAVRSGDVVFVDRHLIADTEALQQLALQERNLELQRESQRRQARVQLVQMGVAVVSAAATIITTYMFIRRN